MVFAGFTPYRGGESAAVFAAASNEMGADEAARLVREIDAYAERLAEEARGHLMRAETADDARGAARDAACRALHEARALRGVAARLRAVYFSSDAPPST